MIGKETRDCFFFPHNSFMGWQLEIFVKGRRSKCLLIG